MEVERFIHNFKTAFGERVPLPIAFWYSDSAIAQTSKINGCFFKAFDAVRKGVPISLSADVIGCGGGKFYTGFAEMPEHVPTFVSLKERYKKSPELVLDFLEKLQVPRTANKYLHFSRIDNLDSFDNLEALLFFATPDVLSGLTAWAFFDSNDADAVRTSFGSGCSTIVTQALSENARGGRSTFLGLFDPSVRICFEPEVMSFVIPMSRFKEMYHTMTESCLFDTPAWSKIRARL